MVDRHHSSPVERSDNDPATFEGVDFGEVRYAMHKLRSLTIANTGRVPATVSFIDRPVGPGQIPDLAPSWLILKTDDGTKLSVENGRRTLEPGEAFNVELELRILDVSIARAFNEGVDSFEDILVLRVENGRDHFIPLHGKWLESSLGSSIDKLIRIPEGGIRKLQHQRPHSSKSSVAVVPSDPVKWSAPRELFRLTEAIEDLTVRSVAEWSMVSGDDGQAPWEKVAGWPFAEESWITTDMNERNERIAAVCEALDTDSPFDQHLPQTLTQLERLESLASFLLMFLEGLSDGVVPESTWAEVESGVVKSEKQRERPTEEEQRTWVQEVLSHSPAHSISFILLCAMIDRIVNEVASAHDSARQQQDHKPEYPSTIKPLSHVRRKTLSRDPGFAHRQLLARAMASIFAPLMICAPQPSKEKDKTLLLDREMRIIELFIIKESI